LPYRVRSVVCITGFNRTNHKPYKMLAFKMGFTRDAHGAKRVLAIVILSVCPSVCLLSVCQPGTDSSSGDIETPDELSGGVNIDDLHLK